MMTPPPYDPRTEPLRYRLNPCDIGRFSILAPLGDGLAALWHAFTAKTECPCCLGTRLVVALCIAFALGAAL